MSDNLQLDFPRRNQTGARERSPETRPAVSEDSRSFDEIHLTDYIKVLARRRWLVATVLLIVFTSVAIYTFTVTPIYRGRVQILIEAENPNVISFKEVIEQDKATNDYYQTQYRILQSRTLARLTLDRIGMWDYFKPSDAANKLSVSAVVGAGVKAATGWFTSVKPVEPPEPGETAVQSAAIDRFLLNLNVSPVRNSRLVELEYFSPQADLAASIPNALAHAYIEQNLDFKYTSSKEASDWLGQRMAEQRKQVEESEGALQRYREQNDAVSLDERQNIVVQKLADLNTAVTRAKTERIQKEAAYNQIKSVQMDRAALDTIPAILANQFIQQQKTELADLQRQQAQLAEKLGERHPDMVKVSVAIQAVEARIRGEIAKVVQSLKNDYETAQSQEQSLVRALDQQKHEALTLNRKGIDYGSLQRDAAANRQIFDTLMQRTKETGISADLKTSNIRIVDAAEVPQTPVRPNKPINLLLGLFGGSLLAVGLAFFVEYLDNRIKSPLEIQGHLGLPFLGMVPKFGENEGGSKNPLINHGVSPQFAEAVRTIRTNVLFSSTNDGSMSLAVTSSGPGEGKTLTACNLALALAQTGQRVLLVDADMRRPRVHEVFGEAQEPGLSNVLVGDTKTSAAVRAIADSNLWVLPAGHIPPNPSELLGSKRFQDFVTTLGEHFAWIIIDTPPVMAVSDAPIVAHITDGVLFVVGAEMTGRNIARTAVDQIARAQGRLIGAVLNRVDLQRNAYYYSQYYRREYGTYYVKSA